MGQQRRKRIVGPLQCIGWQLVGRPRMERFCCEYKLLHGREGYEMTYRMREQQEGTTGGCTRTVLVPYFHGVWFRAFTRTISPADSRNLAVLMRMRFGMSPKSSSGADSVRLPPQPRLPSLQADQASRGPSGRAGGGTTRPICRYIAVSRPPAIRHTWSLKNSPDCLGRWFLDHPPPCRVGLAAAMTHSGAGVPFLRGTARFGRGDSGL